MKLITKITQMIKQAYIIAVNDSDPFPIAKVSYNSKISEVIRFSPYGLCTNAPLNSNVLLLSVHGQESLKYALTDDRQNRYKNLKEGEVVLYNYLSGSYIYLKENGDIEVECKKDEKINVVGDADIDIGGDADIDVVGILTATAPTINLTGSVNINGTLTVTGGNATLFSGTLGVTGETTLDGIPFSTHVHPQGNDSDNDTQVDTGVPK